MLRIDSRSGRWAIGLSAMLVTVPASAQSVPGVLVRLALPLWVTLILLAVVWAVGVFSMLRSLEHDPQGRFPTKVRRNAFQFFGWGLLLALAVYSGIVLIVGGTGFVLEAWMNTTFFLLLAVFSVLQAGVLGLLIRRTEWSGRYAFFGARGGRHE